MKKLIVMMVVLCSYSTAVFAQMENAIWPIQDNKLLNFNNRPPLFDTTPSRYFDCSAAICFPSGRIRFWVNLRPDAVPMLFDARGFAIPNSILKSDHGNPVSNNSSRPIVVPRPGNGDQYYIFYSKYNGLYYCLLDMSLNGGNGAVIFKDSLISNFGTICIGKTLAVKGCEGAWLVSRSLTANQYLSFKITISGVTPVPVRSTIGLMTRYYGEYNSGYSASIKASPDGNKIANFGIYGAGVEIYDFERCSGKLSNPILIDTSGNPSPAIAGDRIHYSGLCFSGNGKLLYVAKSFGDKIDSVVRGNFYGGMKGTVYQFQVTKSTPADIISSKIAVMENPYILLEDLNGCVNHVKADFTDIKMAVDGRIYVHNNVSSFSCYPAYNPDYSVGPAFHVINYPDSIGLRCAPKYNVLSSGLLRTYQLPLDLINTSSKLDTVAGKSFDVLNCFTDSTTISINLTSHCTKWLDGTSDSSRIIKTAGKYPFSYINDCNYRVDTFNVQFIKLPKLKHLNYSCPGAFSGQAYIQPVDTTWFEYRWTDRLGKLIRMHSGRDGDSVAVLDTGFSYVHLRSKQGCDTLLAVEVLPLPRPTASFIADSVVCKNVDMAFTSTSSAPGSLWKFGNLEKNGISVSHRFPYSGNFIVTQIVKNIEGCTDTLNKIVKVSDFKMDLIASSTLVNIGEQVTLTTKGSEPYQIITWTPIKMFPNQTQKEQVLTVDSDLQILVVGYGGCPDTTSITIKVNPVVAMPSAFSPNGDGLNDLFRVTSAGSQVTVRSMDIYNRYGQRIFAAYNAQATRGWDGTYNDIPCEIGTYFYLLRIETNTGKMIVQKGDVILIR